VCMVRWGHAWLQPPSVAAELSHARVGLKAVCSTSELRTKR
jgi:hypothetical protein